jgi:hypothetical protein
MFFKQVSLIYVFISDDAKLIGTLGSEYHDGVIWITVPAAEAAAGPLVRPEYLAHQTNARSSPTLQAFAAKRGDRTKLPACRPAQDRTDPSPSTLGDVS